jgi:flagellar biosynthesis/type III secretory pathway protein FliH
MNDAIVHVHHQKVPAIGGHRDHIEEGREELDAVAENQRPGAEAGNQEDRLEGRQAHARLKQSEACEPEDVTGERMVNQPV